MIKSVVVLCVIFLEIVSAYGQRNSDVQYRLIPSVEYKLNKKWKLSAEYRYSLENDLQKFRNSYFQVEGKYSRTKSISLSGGYRFTTSYENDAHRFFAAVEYNFKISKKFSLSATSKYQYSTNSFNQEYMAEFKAPVKMVRQKFSFEYNVPRSKVSFSTGAEIFLRTDGHPLFTTDRMRYMVSTGYNFQEYGKFGLSFFFDNRFSPKKTDRFVLVTRYTISLDKFSNKSKEGKKGNT